MGDDAPGGFDALLDQMVPGGADRPNKQRRADAPTHPLSPVYGRAPAGTDGATTGSLAAVAVSPAVRELPDPTERLSWAALQVALLVLAVYLLIAFIFTPAYLTAVRGEAGGGFPMRDVAAFGVILLSLGVFALARRRALPEHRVMDLGLAYYVAVALGIALIEHWEPWPTDYLPPLISWTCLWIALYPMAVPSAPTRLAVAAFAAASAGPVAYLATSLLRDNPSPATAVLAWLFLPPYLTALVALYPSRLIHRIQARVEQARALGPYELQERIGEGGMGEVWRARHRLLARPAALKLIRPEALTRGRSAERAALLARFEREARTTANLRSPHTVELYDFGVTEDGSFYYVMELLDGIDLETLVSRHGPQPEGRVVHFLAQACASLAEAHEAGLVHRDVKPGNLLACRYGLQPDFLKILDFGLVHARGTERSERLTGEGHAPGTPEYLAPEVARGRRDVDGRADLYALGCVGYWLLTGRPVFERDNAAATIIAQVEEAPVPPSARLGRSVTPCLERLLLECLAKEPADRPQTAADLAARLEACEVERWTADDAARWWGAHGAADDRGPAEERITMPTPGREMK